MLKWARRQTRRPGACGKTDGRMEVDWNSAKMYWKQCHWKSWKQFCQYSERCLRQFQVSSLYFTDLETSGRSWKGSHFCKSIFRWFPLLLSICYQASKESDLDTVSGAPSRWVRSALERFNMLCWCSMFCPQSIYVYTYIHTILCESLRVE